VIEEPGAESITVPPAESTGVPVPGVPVPAAVAEVPGQEGPARRRRRWIRTTALIALGVLGLGALCGGGFAVVRELTRPPTTAEVTAAGDAEIRLRWRFRSAGEIFPATVPYLNGEFGDKREAHRIGVAPQAGCAPALDPQVAEVVIKNGCVTVLRATYADQSGALLMTVGIAVMPDPGKADAAMTALSDVSDVRGVRPVSFPGTVADRFGDFQRQRWSMQTNRTSYLFLGTEGWADGRRAISDGPVVEDFVFSKEIFTTVMGAFARNELPCKVRAITC
jgi:anti-sigma factor RsiW